MTRARAHDPAHHFSYQKQRDATYMMIKILRDAVLLITLNQITDQFKFNS